MQVPIRPALLFATAAFVVSVGLQGCGTDGTATGGGSVDPSFKLPPIAVRGSQLYNTKTGKEWHAVGIGMPNAGDDVDEWIKVLERVKNLGSDLNAIRIYELPKCATEAGSLCFKPFMKKADELGVYVMVPGTGRFWGYFPGTRDACGTNPTPQTCYEHGGVLGFGRMIIDNFAGYPNTLAIVAANEMDQNLKLGLPVLKAYVRDLKNHMKMCNAEPDSPALNKMRYVPIMYAATDGGDQTWNIADYLFCGSKDASIDIFGLNTERWVSDAGGRNAYNTINEQVAGKKWPGAFMHSEEGGPYGGNAIRTWNQVTGYFDNWGAIKGFMAYVYHGHDEYNMFDGDSSTATELPDGKTFFSKLPTVGDMPNEGSDSTKRPLCAKDIEWHDTEYPMSDYNNVKVYDTGPSGWAKSCPKLIKSLSHSYDNATTYKDPSGVAQAFGVVV